MRGSTVLCVTMYSKAGSAAGFRFLAYMSCMPIGIHHAILIGRFVYHTPKFFLCGLSAPRLGCGKLVD